MTSKKQHNFEGTDTWHEEHMRSFGFGQRLAYAVAREVGSWRFIILQSIMVAVWVLLNVMGVVLRWDPYPFILLNLLFSTQAAYTAPIILMAQNRQAERDRIQAQADYKTNVEAKLEIEALQRKLNSIEVEKLDKLVEMMNDLKLEIANLKKEK